MKIKRTNTIIFTIEFSVYTVLCFLFFCLSFIDDINNLVANIIYVCFLFVSFGWLFVCETILKCFDNAVHLKMFAKYYIPNETSPVRNYRRKGLWSIIVLWICYLSFIVIIKTMGLLNWQLFLAGASLIFALNSVFTRKICLLSVLFLKNKNHCCKNCGINSWDYAIFASALMFAPQLSIVATIINWTIISVSVVMLVIWEINYHKHPYRFYPETNKTLICTNCLKQCKDKQ